MIRSIRQRLLKKKRDELTVKASDASDAWSTTASSELAFQPEVAPLVNGTSTALDSAIAASDVSDAVSDVADFDSDFNVVIAQVEREAMVLSTEPPTTGEIAGTDSDALWCLGIDVGTTEISATLLNYQTGKRYPIVWQEMEANPAQPFFRLPAIAYITADQLVSVNHQENAPLTPAALGYQALETELAAMGQPASLTGGLLLSSLKPYLNASLPYWAEQSHTWEPTLQWTDLQALSCRWLQQTVVALLTTLLGEASFGLQAGALGMTPKAFKAAIAQVVSVVVGCPTGWSDTYCFNLREAVLQAGLVTHAEQIYFIEEAIAALLATLPLPVSSNHELEGAAYPINRPDAALQGGTLVVSVGATTTELLLVDLPQDGSQLTREDLFLRSLAYAGDAIDQDIICQLLYPAARHWNGLDLQSLALPLPGEPDLLTRDRLQQRLRSSVLGRRLLNAARQLKLTLSQQDTAVFQLDDQQWTVSQQELHSRVMMPYLQQLNRELNVLLNQTGIAVQAVRQVVCTGGTVALPTIAHWLKQKLPNTRLLHDSDSPELATNHIAHGLATLALYPQMLDSMRHQYSDYFLLHELLRILPNEPLSVGRILQLLEKQGINTNFCQRTLLNLLEGQLPVGLLPARTDTSLLTLASQQNPDYQILTATSLFVKEGNQIYRFNPEMRDRLQQYLNAILAKTHQTLAEPLTVGLEVEVRA